MKQFGTARVEVRPSRSILSPATGFIRAYDFTLNPYRGCQYGCSYCYAAAFSPNEKMRQDWGNWAIVKENAAELLEKELKRWYKKRDRPPRIYMSSVTDPYQPLETQQRLTRQLLEIMLPFKPCLVIQTRSPMILRDVDLLQRFRHLRINMSIPTGSDRVRRDFEPRSPSIAARLQTVAKLRQTIDPDKGYRPKLSITITPLLPILPEDCDRFVERLQVADRIVIQPFHQSNQRSLVAATRSEAIALKTQYAWWYDNEQQSYQQFKEILYRQLHHLELREGQAGFGYE
ncbi:MAG: radical SAM protein [Jaaginema sp. PMC 1080.18]|nr:radical SAM protein [Jaaginema sp. PMC 1080.18]MEC4866711.1 radical SAM protein [Jaaginema sp. PMC 1078.18]